jgi:hypothetical protein
MIIITQAKHQAMPGDTSKRQTPPQQKFYFRVVIMEKANQS